MHLDVVSLLNYITLPTELITLKIKLTNQKILTESKEKANALPLIPGQSFFRFLNKDMLLLKIVN